MPRRTRLLQKIALMMFGVFLSLVILEVGLRVSAFFYLRGREGRNSRALAKEGAYRILFLGESTSSLGGINSYPRKVGRILEQGCPQNRFAIINKAVPGTNTNSILGELEYNLRTYQPRLVVVMMGINDGELLLENDTFFQKTRNFVENFRVYQVFYLVWMRLHEESVLAERYIARARVLRDRKLLPQSRDLLLKAVEIFPGKVDAYLELGYTYTDEEEYALALEAFQKALELNPDNYEALIGVGNTFRELKMYPEAERALLKVTQAFPERLDTYLALGVLYSDQQDYPAAENIFLQAIKNNFGSYDAYIECGLFYLQMNRYKQAQSAFEAAVILNPANASGYTHIAFCYEEQGDFERAEEFFKKAIAVNPQNEFAFLDIAWFYYKRRGDSSLAEKMFRQAIRINPKQEFAYTEFARYFQERGNMARSDEVLREFITIMRNTDTYIPLTRVNYVRLKGFILDRGIKLICVQYPMRSVERLRQVLEPVRQALFVDNEVSFRRAVSLEGYDSYFVDRFAGDFGHLTDKGNDLLASNVAQTILKEFCHEKANERKN